MTTALRIGILAALVLFGALLGWCVNGWRLGQEIDTQKAQELQLQQKAEAAEETARIAAQHQITKVEKVYVERKAAQSAKDKKTAQQADALPDAGLLPGPYRVLHDYAATGTTTAPDDTARANAAPVAPRTFARSVADNYARAHDSAERLAALQEIVRASDCFDLATEPVPAASSPSGSSTTPLPPP